MRTIPILCAVAILLTGCIHTIAINTIGGILDNGFDVINEEQDLDIAEKSIASNLKLLEALIKSDPGNEHFLLMASEGYSSYSLGFVEDDSIERAKLFYLRGKEYGLRVLKQHKQFADALDGSINEFQLALAQLTKEDVPAVFWTAVGWGSYSGLSLTDPGAIADIPKIEAMMKFVMEEDSTYFHGGALFFLGALYGGRTKILGGEPERSHDLFDRCLKINQGKFLMTYYYYARSYSIQTQNRELFKQCLSAIDAASLNVLPESRLSNAIAKRKSHLLREKIDSLF